LILHYSLASSSDTFCF